MVTEFRTDPYSDESYLVQLTRWLKESKIEDSFAFCREYISELRDSGDYQCIARYAEDMAYQERSTSRDEVNDLIDAISAVYDNVPLTLIEILSQSRKNAVAPVQWSSPNEDLPSATTPFWGTGCEPIDELTGGGAGMVVCAGVPKVGKSLIALSSSVEAARSGFKTIYVNAEMSNGHLLQRFHNYMKKRDPVVGANLHIAHVGPGLTIDTLFSSIKNFVIQDEPEKLLIVLDSINRIVEFGCSAEGSEESYWKLLADWSAWAMNSRRASEGRISWLLISELNSQGTVKGRNLEYTADIVIRINGTGVDDVVEIDVPYSRLSKSGRIGMAYRDFSAGRFFAHDD
jgi:predicted ATP-dependent serine protease